MYPIEYCSVVAFVIWSALVIYAITDLSQSSERISQWIVVILMYVGTILVFIFGHLYEKCTGTGPDEFL